MRRNLFHTSSNALLTLAAAALAGCGTSEGQIPEEETPTPSVEAVQARCGALPLSERLTGTVRASGQVAIYPETSGPVVEVLVSNGDRVSAGDPLVRIRGETSDGQLQQSRASLSSARAQREQARANVEQLERRYERARELVEEEFISREEFEQLEADLASARAELAQAEAAIEMAEGELGQSRESVRQTVVRAPIDGRVGRRNAEVGMYVTGSDALFTIGRLEEMQIEVPITQEMLSRIEVGQTARIRLENLPDTVIEAEVSRISPFIEPGSFSAEAEIDVPNPDGLLLPGMFVTVDVLYGESEQATLVPKSALYDDPGTGALGIYVAPSLGLETRPVMPEGDERAPLTAPTITEFERVDVLAEGRHVVGVSGIDPDTWVVVVGQHLLSSQDPEEGPPQARVRPIRWERLIELQALQREDLLRQFLERQQEVAQRRLDSAEAAERAARGEGSDDESEEN
ncbi:MAG: efflux RND transporter periplasmic adaptor subunit [Gemmatimonadota bacterium]